MVLEEKENKSGAPAVEMAIKILTYLSRYRNKNRTLAEIARDLNINKSSCHRILKVLLDYRLVSYDKNTRQFSLGSFLIVLGSRASEFNDYLKIAKQHLKELAETTKQTCVLVEPIANNRLVYIAKEEPEAAVRITVSIGQSFPVTSASFGKCYLAFLPEKEAREIVKEVGIKQFTDKSITNVEEFFQSLEVIRKQGYAVSFEEHTPGVFGISAPVFDNSGSVRMVVSCIGLASSVNEETINFYADKVKTTAQKITAIFSDM
ncbi:IclR family transcriptional regulator [Carboxydothermus hydrogenoformans]|uniref:Transcriptional regulator, IclR family n=1 Tax=Carboxydothermus hydrogenoformans (strain ATCC BAA-161 / DSM 6008 / Z-2901) TaxID=246194 RepID=Q3ABB9_CARHZ|nr:IclR family transcriptional regulator [Carboxydothermus hydrogenoformans]ABB14653.1 transcriptional regulator, IclR family [Carboxydothermus hydrogenoformans Z-2901]